MNENKLCILRLHTQVTTNDFHCNHVLWIIIISMRLQTAYQRDRLWMTQGQETSFYKSVVFGHSKYILSRSVLYGETIQYLEVLLPSQSWLATNLIL